MKPRILTPRQEKTLAQEFLQGALIVDLAGRYGCSQGTVQNVLRRQQIPPRPRHEVSVRVKVLGSDQEKAVVAEYKRGSSLETLAAKFRCSPVTVRNTLIRHGVPRRGAGRLAKTLTLTKACSVCKRDLPRSCFYSNGVRGSECRECTRLKNAVRYENDNEGFRTKRQNAERVRKTGWTPKMVAAALESQGGRCAICETSLCRGRGPTGLHADHDHNTQAVRGLLCGHCNRGLGFFKDSPKSLQAAVRYLLKYGGSLGL